MQDVVARNILERIYSITILFFVTFLVGPGNVGGVSGENIHTYYIYYIHTYISYIYIYIYTHTYIQYLSLSLSIYIYIYIYSFPRAHTCTILAIFYPPSEIDLGCV